MKNLSDQRTTDQRTQEQTVLICKSINDKMIRNMVLV